MKKLLLISLSILAFCGSVFAQGIKPPAPRYEQYGSYSRQMQVYQNVQTLQADRRLREYRRFREEIRRQTPPQRLIIRRQPARILFYNERTNYYGSISRTGRRI